MYLLYELLAIIKLKVNVMKINTRGSIIELKVKWEDLSVIYIYISFRRY